jgi:hypothetical protein
MGISLRVLLYEGAERPPPLELPKGSSEKLIAWGSSGKDAGYLNKLRQLLGACIRKTADCFSS